MNKLKELRAKRLALLEDAQKLIDVAKAADDRALTAEERKQFDELRDQANAIKGEIAELEADEARKLALAADLATSQGRRTADALPDNGDSRGHGTAGAYNANAGGRFTIPATVRRVTSRNFPDSRTAYAFAQWMMAVLFRQAPAVEYCQNHGLELIRDEHRAATEALNTAGGYLVPDEFESTLIDLRDQYGVARRNARLVPMAGDKKSVPRRVSGLTAYWIGENTAITESQKGWDRVNLIAKKCGVLAKYSSELDEDSVIGLADDLAAEIAWTFAKLEDDCTFKGDGSSTYAGIVGIPQKLSDDSSAGLIDSGNDTWGEIVLTEFNEVVGALHTAAMANARWYCSNQFFATVMQKLMYAAGGNTVDMIAGGTGRSFLGFPVELTPSMPTATAISTVQVILADLRMAMMFGDRRRTTIAMSEHVNFAEDEIAIRGTQRFDVNVHDVGVSGAVGPVAALATAAS